MAYEKEKDVVLFTAGEVELGGGKTLVVEVVSYNGGPKKVALTECSARWTGKAGRIPVEVAGEVGKLMVKAAEWAAAPSPAGLKLAA